MALKKGEYEKQASSDMAARELRKGGSGPMKKYSVFLPANMVPEFKMLYLESHGLSLSSRIRLVVGELMEKLRGTTST